MDRKTVRKYLAPAEAAGLVPGGPPVSAAEWATRVREWFPELTDTRLRQVSWPAMEAHRDYIHDRLQAGVTAATIHQRLRDEHGLEASVASLRRWIRANLPEDARREQVRVLRPDVVEPGSEGQVPRDGTRVQRHLDTRGTLRRGLVTQRWRRTTMVGWLLRLSSCSRRSISSPSWVRC